ncbi:MAG TPA: translation initiation factor IF-2 subunit beta [archaeon]|nr:translation initiation factor IF-2 subunit beta [archaeon]
MEKLQMNYEEMLTKAIEKLPKKQEAKDRFVVPDAMVEISGSRSIFKNFGEVADKLRREHAHLAKYLSKEIATAGSVQGVTLVFQGNIRRDILQKKIVDYVKEFVYCKECGEPDTKLVKRDRVTLMVCEACGAKHPVRNI